MTSYWQRCLDYLRSSAFKKANKHNTEVDNHNTTNRNSNQSLVEGHPFRTASTLTEPLQKPKLSKKEQTTLNAKLIGAFESNKTDDGMFELVRDLLQKGADPKSIGYLSRTALMLASMHGHIETAKLLIITVPESEREAYVKQRTGFGNNALMFAAMHNHTETIKLNLEFYTDYEIINLINRNE